MYPYKVYISALLLNGYRVLKLYLVPILMYTFSILFVFQGGKVLAEYLEISKIGPFLLCKYIPIGYRMQIRVKMV